MLIRTKTLFIFVILTTSILSQSSPKEFFKVSKIDSIAVLFEFGKSSIRSEQELIKRLNSVKNPKGNAYSIVLKSYTDSVGKLEYNQLLASKRLFEVNSVLKKSNLVFRKIDSLNLNEQRINLVQNDSLFRRVDIIINLVEKTYKINEPIPLKLNFEPGKDVLLGGEKNTDLHKLIYLLKMDKTIQIKLNGHVAVEPDQQLSLNRALRVKDYLVKNGIAENRIFCEGFSNTKPKVQGTNEASRAINRRVEVVFIQ